MTTHYLYRTFEYCDPAQNGASIELRLTFEFHPGYAAQIYGDPSQCHPAESGTRDLIRAEREIAGKWVPVSADEWLHTWCVEAFEAAEDDDLVRAMGEEV
jgi:hypothetical protein